MKKKQLRKQEIVDSVARMMHFIDGHFASPFIEIILMYAGNFIMIKLYNFTVFSRLISLQCSTMILMGDISHVK